jgi:hypothetical protein
MVHSFQWWHIAADRFLFKKKKSGRKNAGVPTEKEGRANAQQQ